MLPAWFLAGQVLKHFSTEKHKKAYFTLQFNGEGQPKVIILTLLVVLVYPMLLIKFQGHRTTGSGFF